MKRASISEQAKRSIVLSILEGTYTVARAARFMRVQPATIRRWLTAFEQDVLSATAVTNK